MWPPSCPPQHPDSQLPGSGGHCSRAWPLRTYVHTHTCSRQSSSHVTKTHTYMGKLTAIQASLHVAQCFSVCKALPNISFHLFSVTMCLPLTCIINPFTGKDVQNYRSDLPTVTQLVSYGAKHRKSCSPASQHSTTLSREHGLSLTAGQPGCGTLLSHINNPTEPTSDKATL